MKKMEKCNISRIDVEIKYKENLKEALKKRKKYIREALKKQGLDLECYEWNHEIRLNITNFFINYSEREKNFFKNEMEKKLDKTNYLVKNNFPQDFEERRKKLEIRTHLKLVPYNVLLEKNSSEPIFAVNELNIDELLEEIFKKIKEKNVTFKINETFKKIFDERKEICSSTIDNYLKNKSYNESVSYKFSILLSNHWNIASKFLEELISLSENDCIFKDENKLLIEKNATTIWNRILIFEIYNFLSFSLENIYSARLNSDRENQLLKMKLSLIKLKYEVEKEVKKTIEFLSEKKIHDEWYYNLYFFLSLDILFEDSKKRDEEKIGKDTLEADEYVKKINFEKQIVENLNHFPEIKYKRLKCNRKQPNDYKERMINIEELIIDMKSKKVGVILPKIEEVKIFLYYILYLDSKFRYKGNTLLYWMKVFIKNNQKLDKEEEYLDFLGELNFIIKTNLFEVCDKKDSLEEILEIKKIVKELLMLLINIPTVGEKYYFLVKILKNLKNNQGVNLNSVTSVINSF